MASAAPSTSASLDGWRELHRTNDLDDARTVATTIAAMEFDVKWSGEGAAAITPAAGLEPDDGAEEEVGRPPYIIMVREEDWPALREVLESIIEEQEEFDFVWRQGRERRRQIERWMVVAAVIGSLLVMFLASLGCAAEERHLRPQPLPVSG